MGRQNNQAGRSKLLVALALAAALLYYVQGLGPGERQETSEMQAQTEQPKTPAAQDLAVEADSDNEQTRSDSRPPELVVTITNSEGRELGTAQLVALGPLEAGIEPDFESDDLVINDLAGREEDGVLVDLDPGRWALKATAPLHFPRVVEVELVTGERTEIVVVLKPAAVVEGRITNAFGSAFGNGWVWFLPPDRKHPDVPRTAEGLVRARVDAAGHFESTLLRPGHYLLSFGPAGRAHLQDDAPRRLKGVTRYSVDGVVAYRSQVSAEILGVSPGESRPMEVALLQRKAKKARGEGHPEHEFEPAKDKGEDGERWKTRSERRLGASGKVLFTRLDADSYRLSCSIGNGYFVSDQEIRLGPDSAVLVTAHVNEFGVGTKKKPGAMAIEVTEVLPDLSLGGPGFHWH